MSPVIDFHVHIGGIDPKATGCFMSGAQKTYLRGEMPLGLRAQFRIAEWFGILDSQVRKRLLGFIEEAQDIDHAVVLAIDGVYDREGSLDRERTGFFVPNDYVIGLKTLCPKVIPAASVNPMRRDWSDELDRVAAAGVRVIKWLPSSQLFDPAESRFAGFYRKLVDLKLILLSHTGFEHTMVSTTKESQEYGHPLRLLRALDAGVVVVMAHSGTSGGKDEPEYFDDFVALARRYPHLYGDMAAFTHWTRAKLLPEVLHHDWVHERLIHGSDATLQPSVNEFAGRIDKETLAEIASWQNPIRKDLAIKRALGFPDAVFTRAAGLLGIS
ncbi:MAG: hypothetical protein AABZ44_10215 [Elusimicrobiota bacterium]